MEDLVWERLVLGATAGVEDQIGEFLFSGGILAGCTA